MRTLRFVLLLLLFSFVASSFILTATIYYSGKISINSTRFSSSCKGMSLLVKAEGKQVASCIIDSTSHYELFFTDLGQQQFEFYLVDYADTLLLQTVQPRYEENILDFSLPKTYVLENEKAICPICHHADQVVEIRYGDGLDKPGAIAGGCIISLLSPYWLCKRDHVKF